MTDLHLVVFRCASKGDLKHFTKKYYYRKKKSEFHQVQNMNLKAEIWTELKLK